MTHDDFLSTSLRSNKRYDILIELKSMHEHLRERSSSESIKSLELKHKKAEKGILGQCSLRKLSYFDVGSSFMADSLHNIYIGAFVSNLNLTLRQNSRLIILETNDAIVVR